LRACTHVRTSTPRFFAHVHLVTPTGRRRLVTDSSNRRNDSDRRGAPVLLAARGVLAGLRSANDLTRSTRLDVDARPNERGGGSHIFNDHRRGIARVATCSTARVSRHAPGACRSVWPAHH